MDHLKSQFIKKYANLPIGVREDIVIVIDGEPLTWKAAKLEIEQETKKGKGILQELVILKLLHDE